MTVLLPIIGASLPNLGTLTALGPAPVLALTSVDCTFIQYQIPAKRSSTCSAALIGCRSRRFVNPRWRDAGWMLICKSGHRASWRQRLLCSIRPTARRGPFACPSGCAGRFASCGDCRSCCRATRWSPCFDCWKVSIACSRSCCTALACASPRRSSCASRIWTSPMVPSSCVPARAARTVC